jgi:glutamyl-tRNA reductase
MDAKTNNADDTCEQIRQQWQAIARGEVSRQRRRLSRFTTDQQMAVESVLVSVANGMFETLFANAAQPARQKCFSIWRPAQKLA